MDTPVFTVLYQPQDRFTGEPARPTDQLHIFPKRIDRTAGTGKSTGAVVAGGVIERVGAFQIRIAGERLLDILEVGKADAREALKAGTMTGTMSYSSVKYTEAALKLAIAIAQGKEYAEPIYLPLTLVTVDNVAELDNWA